MAIPYKNPNTPIFSEGTTSVNPSSTFGNTFSVYNIGGYMEVGSLSDLSYTIPTGTTGSIEFSGNTIPIEFLKGGGQPYSPDVLTLYSDNISSGRRRLGMLVYVHEEDQVYQFHISGYTSLFTAATASTNCVSISEFGTLVRNNTPQGRSFINAWTASTIEGVAGYTSETATWRKFNSGTGGGGSGFTSVRINNVSQFTSNTNSFINFSGVNVSISSVGTNTLVFSAGTGGGSGGTSNLQYFVTGSTPSGVTLNNGDRWFDTNTGIEVVWITDVDGSQWIQPTQGGGGSSVSGNYLPLSGGTVTGGTIFQSGLTANTISATTYQNLPYSGTVTGTGTNDTIPKWLSSSNLTDSTITDDGTNVTIPNLIISTSATWSPATEDPPLDPGREYYPLYTRGAGTEIRNIDTEGYLTGFDLMNQNLLLIRNPSDHRAIQIFYSIRSEDDKSYRSGQIIANWDKDYSDFRQLEYGPVYYFESGFSVDPPSVVYNGAGTELAIYVAGVSPDKVFLRIKYILL